MKISTAIKNYVYAAIRKGGKQTNRKDLSSAIDNRIYGLLQKHKLPYPLVPVRSIASYIDNEVSRYLQLLKDKKDTQEPAYGELIVTSIFARTGILDYKDKKVVFLHRFPIRTGMRYPYIFDGTNYKLQEPEEGKIGRALGCPGFDYNLLIRHGAALNKATFSRNVAAGNVSLELDDIEGMLDDTYVWHEEVEGVPIFYFDGKIYRETINVAGASDNDFSLDFTAEANVLYDAASLGSTTYTGYSFSKSRGQTKIAKILPYKNLRFVILFTNYTWYQANIKYFDDYWGYMPVGSGSAHSYYMDIYELLVINIDDSSYHKYAIDHSLWNVIPCPHSATAGYLDIAVDAEDPERLILLKSGDTPAYTDLTVSYYSVDVGEDTQVPPIPLAAPNATKDGHVLQIPYTLSYCSADAESQASASSLTIGNTIFSTTGAITEYKPLDASSPSAITGGVLNMAFTQQPESFNIYLLKYCVGYKQDTATPPTPPDNWQDCYALTSVGFVDIVDATDTPLHRRLTAATAAMPTVITYAERTSNPTKLHMTWLSTRYNILKYQQFFMKIFRPTEDKLAEGTYATNAGQDIRINHQMNTGRALNGTTLYTYSSDNGYTQHTVTLSYPTAAASHLADDRFVALTDFSGADLTPMFLWFLCNIIMTFIYYETTDEPPVADVNRNSAEQQGFFLYTLPTETKEQDVLTSIRDSQGLNTAMVSSRLLGPFISETLQNKVEFTNGWNNVAVQQISDSEVLLTVNRTEVMELTESGTWTRVEAPVTSYTEYSAYLQLITGTDDPETPEDESILGLRSFIFPHDGTFSSAKLPGILFLYR